MIVECSNCDTRFQLDDARVPLRGIRVRCSRCKEAFFLEHPDADKADALNDVAEQAVRGAAPDPTQDLRSAPGSGAESEEEDWEFNGSLPGGDANDGGGGRGGPRSAPAAARSVREEADDDEGFDVDEDEIHVPGLGVDDMSVDDEDDLVSGLDLAGGDSSPTAPRGQARARADSPAESEDESDFGDMSDFSSRADEPRREAPAPAPPAAAPTPAAKPAAAATPEIGEPEDWDFFSDESQEDPSLESRDEAMGRAMQAVGDPSRLKSPARDPDMGSVGRQHGARLEGLRSLVRGIGWLATCGLLGLGIARGVIEASSAPVAPIREVDLGVFEAQQVRGTWLETARSTELYAVAGDLVNQSAEPRMAGTGLRVALVAPDGSELDYPAARAGLLISETELRELPAGDLARAYQRAVSDLSVMRLEPGQAVRFQAFFEPVPDAATGFVIEMEGTPPPLPRETAPAWDDAEEPPEAGLDGGLPGEEGGPSLEDGSPSGDPGSGGSSSPTSGALAPATPQPVLR